METEKIKEQIVELFADVLEIDFEEVDLDSSLVADLGADSLDIVDLSFSLGKLLSIKMPQKTVLMHAEELSDGTDKLVENDRITAFGAELLRAGPNGYSDEEVYPGIALMDIFENTKVRHWVNLCNAIMECGLSGDELIETRLRPYLQRAVA